MAISSIVRAPFISTFQDWTSNTTIPRHRPVVYQDTLYRCDVTHTSGATFDPSKFTALAGMGEAPIDGQQYARKDGAWDTLTIDTSHIAIDMVANSNGITAGNVVELVSTGGQNVQNIYYCEAPTIGSLLTLDGTNNVYSMSIEAFSSNTALACWNIGSIGKYQTLDVSGATPVLVGSPVTDSYGKGHSSSRLDSTHIAVAGHKGDGSTNGFTLIATYNGTNSVTLSTAASIATATNINLATCALTSSNWFVACADTNSDCQIRTAVSNGTNAPTLGTALNVNGTDNCAYLSLARTSSTTAMLAFQSTSGSSGNIVHVTGGTTNAPSASSLALLDTGNCTFITQSPIDSNHTLCAYNNATTSNGCLAVILANGTNAPTVISRAVFGVAVSVGYSYVTLSGNSSTTHTLSYKNEANGYGYVNVVNIDANYNLTISKEYGPFKDPIGGASIASSYNAVAALSATQSMVAMQLLGSYSDGFAGTLTLTPTPVISGQLVGIAQTSATNGATASVGVGPLVSGTFTSGADYYVSGAGGLTTNATPVHVLKAKSTTEGVFELRGNPEAGKQNVWEITIPGAFTWTAPEDGEYEIVFCGGGGSGGRDTPGNFGCSGGNSGNVGIFTKRYAAGYVVSGTIGSGAGGVSSTGAGASGQSTTVESIVAAGGRAGVNTDIVNASFVNYPNTPPTDTKVLMGAQGGAVKNGGYGGVTPYLGNKTTVDTDVFNGATISGTRGGGGCGLAGGSGPSGSGGDGVVRITLIHGS